MNEPTPYTEEQQKIFQHGYDMGVSATLQRLRPECEITTFHPGRCILGTPSCCVAHDAMICANHDDNVVKFGEGFVELQCQKCFRVKQVYTR